MVFDVLVSKLELLSRRIIEETISHINNGEEKEFSRDYLKPEFYDFHYEPYGICYSVDLVPQQKIEWSSFDRALFFQNVIRKLPEYEQVRDAIREEYPASEENRRAARALVRFAESVASKTYDGKTGKVLDKYVSILINDLRGGPIEWMCKSWLTGIWLEEESHEVSPGLSIRRPKPIDLEEEWTIGIDSMKRMGYEEEFDPFIPTILNPGSEYGRLASPLKGGRLGQRIIPKLSAIIELACRARNIYEVSCKISLILDCMTFFGTGAAFQIKTAMHPKSFVERPHIEGGYAKIPLESYDRMPPDYGYRGDYYQYQLNTLDMPKLARFIKQMGELYPSQGIVCSLNRNSPVSIAFQRYQTAFLWSGITGQITSSMMALEALLLKESEKTESSHKLSQRTSVLMKFFGWHPFTVYRDVKKSYDIRSKYVHGSDHLLSDDRDAMERAKRALAYVRNTLLLFLLLKILDGKNKEAFIDEIDESLLAQHRHTELSKKIPQQRWLCHPR